mgnify:CR=1 FL=1
MKKECKQNRGITLIALIITIIILLILVGVSINLAIKGDLFGSAQKAVSGTNAKVSEQQTRVDELMGELDRLEEQPGTTDDGEPAFKIEGKAYKVEKDMTWAQWIESEYNTDKYRIEGNTTNGVVLKNDSIDTIKYCPKTTQIALAKDAIIVGQDYTLSTIKLPVYWYLSEAGEYVSATDDEELKTALNNKAQLAHCPDYTSNDAQNFNGSHYLYGLIPDLKVEGLLSTDESLVLTRQIATPHYKYAEQIIAFNGDDSTLTIQELLDKMGIDTSKEIVTNAGNVIKINECETLSPLFEIYLTNSQNDRKYDLGGTKTISMQFEPAKESFTSEELLVLYIEADSNNVSFIELKDFDPATGEITIELSKLGVMGVLYKQETLE